MEYVKRLLLTSLLVFSLVNLSIVPLEVIEVRTDFNKQAHAMDMGSMMPVLVGIAAAAVIFTLKDCTTGSWDIKVAMIGAAIALIGAIYAVMGNASSKSDQMDENGETANTREAIDRQIKGLEDTKKALETRLMFELGATVALLVATGIALALMIKNKSLFGGCITAHKASIGAVGAWMTANCAALVTALQCLQAEACEAELISLETVQAIPIIEAASTLPGPSTTKVGVTLMKVIGYKAITYGACGKPIKVYPIETASKARFLAKFAGIKGEGVAKTAAFKAALGAAFGSYANFANSAVTTEFVAIPPGAFEQIAVGAENVYDPPVEGPPSTVMSSWPGIVTCVTYMEEMKGTLASCSTATALGAGGNATAAAAGTGVTGGLLAPVAGIATGIGAKIDSFMVRPGNRAIAYGVASALIGAMAMMTKSQIDALKKRIAKLKAMRAGLKDSKGMDMAGEVPDSPSSGQTPQIANTSADYDKVTLGGKPEPVNLKQKSPCVTANCKSNKIMSNYKTSGIGKVLPKSANSALKKGAASVSAIGNGIQGKNKISGSTLGKIQNLGKQAAVLQKHNDRLKKMINNGLKATGQKPIDFKGLEAGLQKQIQSGVRGNLASGKIDSKTIAGIFGVDAKEIKLPKMKNQSFYMGKGKKKRKRRRRYGQEEMAIPTNEEKALDPNEEQVDNNGVDDEYESNANDINSDTSVPIWKIISTRFNKSGLRRLLQRKENLENDK